MHTAFGFDENRWARFVPEDTVFPAMLLFGNRRSDVRFVVLSPTIRTKAIELLPNLRPYLDSIDHPYLFDYVPHMGPVDFVGRRLEFGFIGSDSIGKGYDLFLRLAQETTSRCLAYRVASPVFSAIGHTSLHYPKPEFIKRPLSSHALSRKYTGTKSGKWTISSSRTQRSTIH